MLLARPARWSRRQGRTSFLPFFLGAILAGAATPARQGAETLRNPGCRPAGSVGAQGPALCTEGVHSCAQRTALFAMRTHGRGSG